MSVLMSYPDPDDLVADAEAMDEYREEVAKRRQERARERECCSDCHLNGGSHMDGCPGAPLATDGDDLTY